MPLVSVIIPSFNHVMFVKKAISSVMEQTYSNVELIVIDDGSSDRSCEEITSLLHQYDFTFITQKNQGVIRTLEKGLSLAKGKYVALIASDDYWDVNILSKAVAACESNTDIRFCCSRFYEVDKKGSVVGEGRFGYNKGITYDFEHVLMFADLPRAFFMANRERMLEKGVFSYSGCVEDVYLYLKLLEDGGKAFVLDEVLAYYRVHGTNTSSNNLMITREHFATIQLFMNKSQNPKKVLREWSLRNANILSRSHKLASLKYLFASLFPYNDLRFYKALFKVVFVWKS